MIVHDRYQNYDSAELGPLVHQLCCAHYPDLRIIPTVAWSVLVGGGARAGWSG
ncbi:MAG: IS66 family transposase [Actinomycetota bacterium]|nr:IS66 family transposase [Actinomycetota bacterium]